jgi:Protein of unknown function with PCYCGC motif
MRQLLQSHRAERKAIGANIAAMIWEAARRASERLVLIASIAVAAACSSESPAPSASAAAKAGRTPAGYTGELPPLPRVQFAAARPAPMMRAAYEFAGRHPEVLRHIPCFCGCERNGHGHNGDCFVARRDAGGRPEWSPHGIGCGLCIDIALEAGRMHKDGAPVADIRRAIDQKYRGEYPTSTPTAPVIP